ncbi:hypothetical protein [Actinocorallia longicatena]|uniref:Polyketide cyclase / dehydrase and lipid transport n=1 Tax=Actinocorallia longicatena TaxID=111803 RepID=A0ABP6QDZ3_9ACTN
MPEFNGPYGIARSVPAERLVDHPAVASWIITAPRYHPLWSQYVLSAVTLDERPGFPPPVLQRAGVTHEINVVTLNPEYGPYEADTIGEPGRNLRFLTPVNVAEQVTVTDEQAVQLAELAARAIVDGRLEPEASNGPGRIRAAWRAAIQETVDHFRDPHHGRAN